MRRLSKLAALAAILLRSPQAPATTRLAALIGATVSKPGQDRASVTEDSE
jgi:hypothetical protein